MQLNGGPVRLVGHVISVSPTGEDRAVLLVRPERLSGLPGPRPETITLKARGPLVPILLRSRGEQCRIEAAAHADQGAPRTGGSARLVADRITVLRGAGETAPS